MRRRQNAANFTEFIMFLSALQIIDFAKVEELYPIYALAIIFIATKGMGMLMRKIGLPQVVGMVLAGLIIGPAFFFMRPGGFHGIIDIDVGATREILSAFATIGVIFILFSSGLETNITQFKKSGAAATLIACMGVLVPLVLGFVGAMFFMPGGIGSAEAWQSDYILNAIFVGAILTATSVGITVETLRELGHLNSKVGQIIVSAAIIDDIIGIIVLSIVTSLKGGAETTPIWLVVVKIVCFFAITIGASFFIRKFFKWLIKRYPNKRRTAILALAVCFLFSFMAETVFGIASITGAYLAGLMLSGLHDGDGRDATGIINKKVITIGYLLFSPVFFANIGLTADFSNFKPAILLFSLVFVVLGILGKIVGCGGIAKACGYKLKDSTRIGCGMIARGEVALAVYSAGKILIATSENGAVTGVDPMIPTVFLILVSSILCPVLLKILFKSKPGDDMRNLEIADRLHNENIGEHMREEVHSNEVFTDGQAVKVGANAEFGAEGVCREGADNMPSDVETSEEGQSEPPVADAKADRKLEE